MRTLPSPDEAANSLISDMLRTPTLQRVFLNKKRESKISFLLIHLIGPETERFAAEPVYSVTGKGFLKSKGVEGLRKETELEDFLRGREGRNYVNQTLSLISEKLGRRS